MLRRLALILVLLLFSLVALGGSPIFAQSESRVELYLDPPTISGNSGDTIDLAIKANPNEQIFSAVDIFLDFDPQLLECVQVQPGTVLTIQLASRVDNDKGEIGYCAGMPLGTVYSSSNSFTVATVSFKVKSEVTGSASIIFHTEMPRKTGVFYAGGSVWGSVTGASAGIGETPAPPPETIVNPEPPLPPPELPPPPSPKPVPAPTSTTTATSQEPTTIPAPAPQMPEPTPTLSSTPAPSSTSPTSQPASTPTPPIVVTPTPTPAPTGMPWWSWVIIGLVAVAVIGWLAVKLVGKAKKG